MESKTYKLKSPGISDHAGYFTIVGGASPVAFFFNSKEMKSFQWIIALMTAYSRTLRAGGSVEKVLHDMTHTFDPGGGYIIPDGSGRRVNSVVHHLGLILEQHVKEETGK